MKTAVHLSNGVKGNKDRYVPLPLKALGELRTRWKTHRNPVWLFPAAGCGGNHDEFATATRPTPHSNVQTAFKMALRKSPGQNLPGQIQRRFREG